MFRLIDFYSFPRAFFSHVHVSHRRQQAFSRSKYQLFPVIQSKMINNDVRKIGNYGNVIYDSGADTPTGRKRIGISATEIELLDYLPPATGNGLTSSTNTAFNQTRGSGTQIPSSSTPTTTTKQNSYQTLSLNREQPNGAVIYQSGDNQQLNSAVDQLLERYAPE